MLEGRSKLSKIGTDIDNLFVVCLNFMQPHVWYILPTDANDIHNIGNATGVSFLLLSKVMLYLKNIHKNDNIFKINAPKFNNMC